MIARRIIRVNGKHVREFSMAHYELLGKAARLKNLAEYAATQNTAKRCIGCGASVSDPKSHGC